jgi:hypothetical protein
MKLASAKIYVIDIVGYAQQLMFFPFIKKSVRRELLFESFGISMKII